MLLFPFVSPIALGCLALGCLSSLDSLHVPPFAHCVCLASAVSPSLSPSLSLPLCSHGASPNFCLFLAGNLVVFQLSPTTSNYFQLSSRRLPMVSQFSSSCLSLVSQLCPSCLPDLSRMWFPRCVSQFPPRFLRVLSNCLPPLSHMCSPNDLQMWFPRCCCLPVAFKVSPFVVYLSSACLPDVVSQLSPDLVSQLCQGFYICYLVFYLFPRCSLPVVP